MSLPLTPLDDRPWAEIVSRARSRIPQINKDWTDFNAHDPGITFIELFAWLAEMQRFRLDQVAADTDRRFLELVDVVPEPLRPARVDVYFDTPAPGPGLPLPLPAGTPVGTPLISAGPDAFMFQVVRSGFITANRLKRVTTEARGRRLDHTDTNAPAGTGPTTRSRNGPEPTAFYAFGSAALVGASLELEFERAFTEASFEIRVDLFEDDLSPPGRHVDETPLLRPSIELEWEFHDGDDWKPLTVVRDTTDRFYRSGSIAFETPSVPNVDRPLQIRCRLTDGKYEIPPRVSAIRLNVFELIQVDAEFNEVVGEGDGRPDQTFQLAHDNVLPTDGNGGLELELGTPQPDGGVAWDRWVQVEDLGASNHRDLHYVLDPSTGELRFGNGLNGRIPERGQIVRARMYRHTRGARGNLAADQSWNLGLSGVRVTGINPRPATGGAAPEEIADARGRAEQSFHEQVRGVTGSDLEGLALASPGLRVARAKTLANYDPRFPCVSVPGSVTVVVVPFKRADDHGPPLPGDGFKRTVLEHLERHRLLTTQLRVVAPEIVGFKMSVRVMLARRCSPRQVRQRLERDLSEFFDALRGGPAGNGWPFGRPIYPSEIHEHIDRDPGVEYAIGVQLTELDTGRVLAIDQPLDLPPRGLPHFSWEESSIELSEIGVGAAGIPDACTEPCAEDPRP